MQTAFGTSGTMASFSKRDLKKKKACADKGITLITIPYWYVERGQGIKDDIEGVRTKEDEAKEMFVT